MNRNRILLSFIMVMISALTITSCTYRSYDPGYDYGYRHGYRHYHAPPPPPRVVVVKPVPGRVIYADRHHYRRHDDRVYRKQYRRNDHYGNNGRHRGHRR
ncbi:hypothetical protein [Dyadobacter beijingensis]|uniref:hypothetical protein n=1 Tax=Dyadobacter beijingensis TaxID=365489 RepID=UPI0012FA6E3D|nr:hypothetical protein [Dyadobacter beijingensis]